MTGPDYLLEIAREAARQSRPYAAEFSAMAVSVFSVQERLLIDAAASRPLRDYEKAPVAIIQAALDAAANANDRESYNEIFRVGLHLVAKWPEYLAITTEGHPALELKTDR